MVMDWLAYCSPVAPPTGPQHTVSITPINFRHARNSSLAKLGERDGLGLDGSEWSSSNVTITGPEMTR